MCKNTIRLRWGQGPCHEESCICDTCLSFWTSKKRGHDAQCSRVKQIQEERSQKLKAQDEYETLLKNDLDRLSKQTPYFVEAFKYLRAQVKQLQEDVEQCSDCICNPPM